MRYGVPARSKASGFNVSSVNVLKPDMNRCSPVDVVLDLWNSTLNAYDVFNGQLDMIFTFSLLWPQ